MRSRHSECSRSNRSASARGSSDADGSSSSDDRRVAEQRPGDRQPLPLADRDVGAAGEHLAEAGVEAARRATAIELLEPGLTGRRQDAGLVVEPRGVAEPDRLADRQHVPGVVLEHRRDLGPDQRRIAAGEVDAVPGDRPRRRRQQLAQQLGQRRLARAVGADDRHDLPAPQLEADAAEGVVGRAGIPVAEPSTVSTVGGVGGTPVGRCSRMTGNVARNASKSRRNVTPSWTPLNAAPADCSRLLSCCRPTIATAASPIVIEPRPARISANDSVAIEHRGGDERPDRRQRQPPADERRAAGSCACPTSSPCHVRSVGATS